MYFQKFGVRNKYRARKTTVDGVVFDSQKEANDYEVLRWREKAGEIADLQRQVPFVLIENQYDKYGKLLERKCEYIADFVWLDCRTGEKIVADSKSKATVTPEYIIKRKLMLKIYGVRVKQI